MGRDGHPRVSLDELERLAMESAKWQTGPWHSDTVYYGIRYLSKNVEWYGEDVPEGLDIPGRYDGRFIAACDPQTILSLIQELRAARDVVEAARRLRDLTSGHWMLACTRPPKCACELCLMGRQIQAYDESKGEGR